MQESGSIGMARRAIAIAVACCLSTPSPAKGTSPTLALSEWSRGIAVSAPGEEGMSVYLWFYEWNMFDAVEPGQHTQGTTKHRRYVSDDGRTARIVSPGGLELKATAEREAVNLALTVTNRSNHDWPKLAAIIPCFNPGPAETRNRQFANTKTYFLTANGLKKTVAREIHFNHKLRAAVDEAATPEGRYHWSHKWPKSDVDATAGLILRESTDGRWVTGIAWDDFLSVQAHNPWECMHLSIRVGPLKRGQEKTIRGRIYLFEGTKEDLLKRYRHDFAPR